MQKTTFDQWTEKRQANAIREFAYRNWLRENTDPSATFDLMFSERAGSENTKHAIPDELREEYLRRAERELRA